MQLNLNESERAFVDAVSAIVRRYLDGPRAAGISVATHAAYSAPLYRDLADNGLFGVSKEPEFGPVGAVLLIEEAAKSPFAVEVAASALIAPLVSNHDYTGPFAIARAHDLHLPIRFLPIANTLLIVSEADLLALPLDQARVSSNGGMYAYPFGAFTSPPSLGEAAKIGTAEAAEKYWRIGLAAEGAALMQAAVSFTVEYVKNRRQFGRPLGSFQAVKHRLAACAQQVRGAVWLARRAAWSGADTDAAMAALYVQQCITPVAYDCHQFNGAMGMTLECPLHFWTYRMKALQGELGGWAEQSQALADAQWGRAETKAASRSE